MTADAAAPTRCRRGEEADLPSQVEPLPSPPPPHVGGSAATPDSRKLQQLVEQAQELRDPVARAVVHECLHSILAFYGNGLARILEVVREGEPRAEHSPPNSGTNGHSQAGEALGGSVAFARAGSDAPKRAPTKRVLDRLLSDPIVSGLLLIHGLHPSDLSERVHQAMEKVRPYMESHGGSVELLSLEGDVARFRLRGACKTCPSSSVTMELSLRKAIEESCPDLLGFEVE